MAYKLLWADDEIELLNAHIIFLQSRGYDVVQVTNGLDAIEACKAETFDLVLLDENMPGLSGLETLLKIKEILPSTPIVMVTKSEEEDIMEQAGEEIVGMLLEEGKEHLDEEQKLREEKAEKLEEKKEEQEAFIEAQKEKKEAAEEFVEDMPMEEMLTLEQVKLDVQKEVQNIVDKMKLVAEDMKGAVVDESV